jgi:acidic leucine-rich nuclear phosphoprotein 32 family protein B
MNISDKYLQETFGKHEPREIEELVFDNFWADKANFTEEEKKALEKYANLIHLSLNNIGLKSLKNLPCIKNLYYLSLNNNELSGDDFDILKTLYPNLSKLKISGNVIEKIDNLLKLKPLKLRKIEVKENPFSIGNDKYKQKLFEMLPSLKIVDQTDKNGDEEETTDYHNEEQENEGSDFNEEEEEDGSKDNEDEAEDGSKDDGEEDEDEEEEDDDKDKNKKSK